MKKLNRMTTKAVLAAVLAAVAALLLAPSASAQLVGAQFVATGNTAYTGNGVLGETFTSFTGAGYSPTVTPINLTENIGQGVSLNVATTGHAFFASDNNAGSATNFFLNDLANYNSAGDTFTLSGLTAGSYSLALYAEDLGDRSGDFASTFTINGVAAPYTVGPTNGGGAFIQQTGTQTGNYEIFSGISPINGDISIVTSARGGGYQEFNGLGLESESVVPEPSTWALLFGGLGTLVAFQRLRRRTA